MINRYLLQAVYRDGGRGPIEYDCWGLVREVRHLFCGKRLMPSWGDARNTQPRVFTQACAHESKNMRLCDLPEHGAIAAAFRGQLCVHVGLVLSIDGRCRILEINPDSRARLIDVAKFEALYQKVRYYND